MQNIAPRTLVADELAADLNVLRADNDDLLALEKLLGHDRGKTTKEVTLGVDDNSLTQHTYISKKFSTASLLEPPPPQNDRRRREEEEKDTPPNQSLYTHPKELDRCVAFHAVFPIQLRQTPSFVSALFLHMARVLGGGGGGLAAFAFSFSFFPLRGKRERGKKVRVAPRSSPPPKKNHQKPPPTTRPATAGLVVSFFTLRKGPSDMVFFSRGKNERGLSPG